jgi:hypothetical protein
MLQPTLAARYVGTIRDGVLLYVSRFVLCLVCRSVLQRMGGLWRALTGSDLGGSMAQDMVREEFGVVYHVTANPCYLCVDLLTNELNELLRNKQAERGPQDT